MSVTSKTATAAIALMIAAGAYPIASMAQTQTETDAVEVEVIEQGETASEAGQEVGQAAEQAGEAVEEGAETVVQGAESAGETVEQGAEAAGEAVEQGAEATGEAVEEGVSEAGEAADEATGTTVEVIEQETDEAADTATTEEDAGEAAGTAAGTAEATGEDAGETAVIDADVDQAGELDEAQMQELEQAEAEGKPVPPTQMIMGVQQEGQWLSSELIDREVRNPEGEVIGDIGAILFSDQGPDGVIVEVGGFLGIGEKDVAIKWNELAISEEGIVVQATEEQLENAPEFVSLEEQQTEADLQAQQEVVDEDQGMMTSGSAAVGEEPAAGMPAEPAPESTQ